MTNKYYIQIRISILGSPAVGKTAIIDRFVNGIFHEEDDYLLDPEYEMIIEVDGYNAHLNIMDTHIQDNVSNMHIQHYWIRESQCSLLIYDICDQQSFNYLKDIYKLIQRITDNFQDEPYAVILVGNKCDHDNEREISYEEAQQLAQEWDNCPFMEISAKQNINVTKAFESQHVQLDIFSHIHHFDYSHFISYSSSLFTSSIIQYTSTHTRSM